MTEKEGLKHNKLSALWREIRWAGKGLLVVIFILLVLFRSPLKAIVLIAFILAAGMILPKRYRKWLWFSVEAGVFILIVWCFIPEDDTGWYSYTFDEEIAALKAKYEIPDEQNAGLLYAELFRNINIDDTQPDFFTKSDPSSQKEPWLSKDHPEMAEWLDNYSDTITELLRVSRMECMFPISFNLLQPANNSIIYSNIRNCAYLLIASANNDVAEGQIDKALEKFVCVSDIGEHLSQQPETIFYFMGTAIESLGMSRMSKVVIEENLTIQQLKILSDSIKTTENNWDMKWRNLLDCIKLNGKNALLGTYYERNSQGKVRISRQRLFVNNMSKQQIPAVNYNRKKFAKLKAIFMWLFLPSSPEKMSKVYDKYIEQYYAMAEPNISSNQEPGMNLKFNYHQTIKLAISLSNQPNNRMHEIYLRKLSARKSAKLLIAIKEYKNMNGQWPQNLDDIKSIVDENFFIDPVNNSEFVYKLTDDDFVFFSKGENNIDDNSQRGAGTDDLAIWPQ
ncbi:hypothetical protein ACFLZ8_05705 [Planctomycetota bacterium]